MTDLERRTCPGDLEACADSDVITRRGWAFHPDRVRCRLCGRTSRWSTWRTDLGTHVCCACDLQGTGGWT
jgi:hypothetical protein